MSAPIQIAVFASGAGSNTARLIDYFNKEEKRSARIGLVVCNKPQAGVLEIARENGLPTLLLEKERFFAGDGYADLLKEKKIRLIVLAGFLWKIPDRLIGAFPGAIINIHPALLPKYGGKGMYGSQVHSAVIANQERESGITIHYVDGHYDNGDIIFQEKIPLAENETPASLARKIQELEHLHFPRVVEGLVIKEFRPD
jgi:phosphoribosylglycinamide formyltransferase-1